MAELTKERAIELMLIEIEAMLSATSRRFARYLLIEGVAG